MNPAVSVIILTHNRTRLICRALQRALDQTFRDFKVIVVDDCSEDDTEAVITNFNDRRIKCAKHPVDFIVIFLKTYLLKSDP